MNTNVRPNPVRLLFVASLLTFTSFTTLPARAADVTVTVTAAAKKGAPPPIKKEDVQVFQGKERVQVADWRHDGPLYLAILIDDSLDTEAASGATLGLSSTSNRKTPWLPSPMGATAPPWWRKTSRRITP
jgi:hypothetical protein